MIVYFLAIVLGWSTPTNQSIVVYEGDTLPESLGWERVGTMDSDRWAENGWFRQLPELGVWAPPPLGEADFYQRSIAKFAGEPMFFVEWAVETDATVSILDVDGTPVALSAYSNGTYYHFTLTDQRVRIIRSALLPVVYVDIAPHVPHTYRIELFSDAQYVLFVDGEAIDSGIPNGPYPSETSGIIWGSRYYGQDLPVQTTRWDYLRYGVIPEDAVGDFDGDGIVSSADFYFAHECLMNNRVGIFGGPGNNSGPGCRFVDFDFDGDTDLTDLAEFQNDFTADE